MNFLDALASFRPMRRRHWRSDPDNWPKWKWLYLPEDSLDNDWLIVDEEHEDPIDGPLGPEVMTHGSSYYTMSRDDFVAADWEILVTEKSQWLQEALDRCDYRRVTRRKR